MQYRSASQEQTKPLKCNVLRDCNVIHHILCLQFSVCVTHLLGPIFSRLTHFDIKHIVMHAEGDLKARIWS